MEYPIRINKYLKEKGLASRKEADAMVSQGNVFINGKRAVLGQKVSKTDEVTLKGTQKTLLYKLFYKPRGVVSHGAQYGEEVVGDYFKEKGLFPIGRLDKESEGLMLITNDGRITERLLDPRFDHEKEYEVRVREKLKSNAAKLFEQGLRIAVHGKTYTTKKANVEEIDEHTFRITLTEGKKHQVRQMCSALNYTITHLARIRIGILTAKNMKPGQSRDLKPEEKERFLKSINLL